MADSSERRMNLAALQRVDPYITSIVATTSQVALYEFNGKTNEWEKTEIEGSLFVYARCAKPSYGFIIMNRLNRNNLVEPLTAEMEFQRQDPFLLYRNSKTVIYGIWFYNGDDCVEVEKLMKKLMDSIGHPKKEENISNRSRSTSSSAPTRLRPTSSDSKTIDIVSMLTKAQNEYNQTKVKTEPKRIDNAIDLADVVRPRPMRMNNSTGPPPDLTIGSSVARSPEPEGTSVSVAALFASAGRQESGDSGNVPKRLRVTPERLEVGKSGWHPDCGSPVGESLHAVLQRLISNTADEDKEKTAKCRPSNGHEVTKAKTPTGLFDNPQDTSPIAGKSTRTKKSNFPVSLSAPVGFSSDIPLMSPMMFSSPKIGPKPAENTIVTSPRLPQINLLTRDQLGQALIHLIENDREFLNTIHEAYVKSLTVLTSDGNKYEVA